MRSVIVLGAGMIGVATALHLMERYPDYHFSMSQPQVYHFLKHDAPDLYQRMKARIAEGRFTRALYVSTRASDRGRPSTAAVVDAIQGAAPAGSDSSATSRRKSAAVVQSASTRARRETKGSCST